MKTLRLLSRDTFYKSLIILIVFFSSVIADDEPIDIWKIEKKDNTIETNNEIEDSTDNQSSIIINNSSKQNIQIISNTSLDEKDLIVGLYDPSDNGLKLDMWINSDGNEIKKIIDKINTLELSEDAQKILEIALLTNSQIPNKNITEKEFINFKIDYLIKKKIKN